MVSSRKLIGTALYLLMWPALLLWVAGDWRWIEGWIFGVWFLGLCAILGVPLLLGSALGLAIGAAL